MCQHQSTRQGFVFVKAGAKYNIHFGLANNILDKYMTTLSILFQAHFNITEVIDLKLVDINGQLNVIWRDNLVPLKYGKNRRFYSNNSLLKNMA